MASLRNALIGLPYPGNTAAAFQSWTLDSTSAKVGFVFHAEEDATITHVGFRYTLRTGTPPTYKAGLQGVSVSTGYPDGTYLGGGSPASGTFTPPADTSWDATWVWIALDNSIAVTRGQVLGLVVEHSAGTCDASNKSSITFTVSSGESSMPYSIYGTWGRVTNYSVFGYKSASKVYGYPCVTSIDGTERQSDTTPDEFGLKFNLDSDICSTFTVSGVEGTFNYAAGATTLMTLYDSANTVLQQVTLDHDQMGTAGGRNGRLMFDESTLTTLNAGSLYRLTFSPQSTTAGWMEYSHDFESDAGALAVPWGGQMCFTSRVDAGSWTDDESKRPIFGLLLGAMSKGSGGSTNVGNRIGPGALIRN